MALHHRPNQTRLRVSVCDGPAFIVTCTPVLLIHHHAHLNYPGDFTEVSWGHKARGVGEGVFSQRQKRDGGKERGRSSKKNNRQKQRDIRRRRQGQKAAHCCSKRRARRKEAIVSKDPADSSIDKLHILEKVRKEEEEEEEEEEPVVTGWLGVKWNSAW